jgi:hypothetical protein
LSSRPCGKEDIPLLAYILKNYNGRWALRKDLRRRDGKTSISLAGKRREMENIIEGDVLSTPLIFESQNCIHPARRLPPQNAVTLENERRHILWGLRRPNGKSGAVARQS